MTDCLHTVTTETTKLPVTTQMVIKPTTCETDLPDTIWLQIKPTSTDHHNESNGDNSGDSNGDSKRRDNENKVRSIQVTTAVLTRVGLFNDLINCCYYNNNNNNNTVPFPTAYTDVAMVYINFINGNYNNNLDCSILVDMESGNLLLQALKLCHYLDDDVFLRFLINYMHGNIVRPSRVAVCNYIPKFNITNSWSSYADMIAGLPSDLQIDIYLLSPFTLIPKVFQINPTFMNTWIKTNINIVNNNRSLQTKAKIKATRGDYGHDITRVNTTPVSNQNQKQDQDQNVAMNMEVKTKIVDVSHKIDNKYLYSTYISYYDDDQTDIHEFICRRANLDDQNGWYYHGISIKWYQLNFVDELNSSKVKNTEKTYFNGTSVGCRKDWYINGNLLTVVNYFDYADVKYQYQQFDTNSNNIETLEIILHGDQFDYHDNGQLERHHYYDHDIPMGIWKHWYKSGNLELEITLDQHGKKHGPHKRYYDIISDCNLEHEYQFDHGKEVGMFKAWFAPIMVTDDIDTNTTVGLPRLTKYQQQKKYEYTFIDDGHGSNNHYIYKKWVADGTMTYDFDYYGDQTTIPNSLKGLTFKDCLYGNFNLKYYFH